jgi:hypothetical protein
VLWQLCNPKAEGWAKKLKGELERIELAYIWQSQAENNANKLCKILRERCNDIERQCIFEHMWKEFFGILLQNEIRVGKVTYT